MCYPSCFTLTEIRRLQIFQVIKENMERSYRNTNIKPGNQITYLRLQVLRERFYGIDEKLATLTKLSLSDLLPFIPNLLSQVWYYFHPIIKKNVNCS